LILVGAIVIGAIAALLIWNYVQGIDGRANKNAKLVDVFVAKSDIKRAATGEQVTGSKAVDKSQIPQQYRPESAISTTDQLAKKVALLDIPKNSVIVDGMFVDPATSQITFRERLKNKDHVAISISTDNIHGVGGFIVPSDEVNMMIFEEVKEVGTQADTPGLHLKKIPRYLYQKVQILAVGTSTVLSPGETVDPKSAAAAQSGPITVNVPPDAALWIAWAQEGSGGAIYMSLVAKDYNPRVVEKLPAVTQDLPGELGDKLTPYGPTGNPTP
jgi:Flp pilus assembly protein CpaB